MRTVIARKQQQGQSRVAAGSNKGLYTMPADFGGVLGVVAEWRLENNAFVYYNHWRGVQIGASSRHCFINENGISENTMIANSFAAPTVTAAPWHRREGRRLSSEVPNACRSWRCFL